VPGVPVTHEHAVVDHAGGLVLGFGLAAVDGAGQVGAARIDGQGDGQLAGVAAEPVGVDVERQVGDLDRPRPVGLGAPDLTGAGAARQEIQLAVGAPARGVGAALVDGQPAALAGVLQVHHVDGARAAVGVHVGGGHRIDDPAAVRRHLGI